MRTILTVLLLLVGLCTVDAQEASQPDSLLIGPGDLLSIHVFDTPELDENIRVSDTGNIHLLLGQDLKVSGLTPMQASLRIREALIAGKEMNDPRVRVVVGQYATQNVSILGEVKSPGAYPIVTPRSIVEVLALAGGLNDVADRHITIEHHGDSSQRVHYFLSNTPEAALDSSVKVMPGDTIFIPRAGIVYVLGDVGRPGGYVLSGNESRLTIVEVVTMAGGTNKTSAPQHAQLVRKQGDTIQNAQIRLGDMQKGKSPDMDARAGDIIYVPFSYMRNFAIGSSNLIGETGAAAIYHF